MGRLSGWIRIAAAALALAHVSAPAYGQTGQTTTPQAASADGTSFGKDAKSNAASIPEQQVDANNVPGYQPAPQGMSDLFGSSDAALNSSGGLYTNGDAWTTMRSADANRSRVDPASLKDMLDQAELINENASGATTETGAGGGQGQCQEVTKPATQVFYDATCDVGETITTVDPVMQYSCPAGWSLSGTTCSFTQTQPADVSYSCPNGGTLQGTNCVTTQTASVSGYTCPSGFSLSGTSCSQTLTQAATVSGYSCPADMTLQGTTCVRTLQQSATPVYSCPAGYSLSGTTCTSTSTFTATPSYYCPSGYTLSGTSCTAVSTYSAAPTYSCPGGFTLSGSTCSQTLSQPATGTQICPSGYTLANGTCWMQTTYAATSTSTCPGGWILQAGQCQQSFSYTANVIYTCPVNFHLDATMCHTNVYQCGVAYTTTRWTIYNGQEVCAHRKAEIWGGCPAPDAKWIGSAKIFGDTYCLYRPATHYQCPKSYTDAPNPLCPNSSDYQTNPAKNYSCPSGGTLSGTTCSGINYIGTTTEYSCPSGGTLSGTSCVVDQSVAPTTSYSCQAGWTLSGSTCYQTNSQAAAVSYSCPSGGTLSGTVCYVNSTTTANVAYSCPAGATLSGSTCTSTIMQNADVSYNCPAGWTLSGNQCNSTQTQTATPIYTCPVGYSLSGSMCSMTNVQPATAQYACPANYSLSGTTCTLTTPAQVNYSCPTDYSLGGTTCSQTLTQAANGTLVCADAAATMQDGKCYGTVGKTDCTDLEGNSQCTFVRDTCLDEVQNGSPCRVTEKTYSCPVPGEQGSPNKEYMCGGDMFCVGGVCQQIEREPSNELKDALVALGAIDQAHKEFDPTKMDMFKGTRETCKQPIFGLVNCCAGKVSGLLTGGTAALAWSALGSGGVTAIAAVATQFLTQFMCSNEEKQLDVKDRLGLCHFVGSYCSSSFLGVCTTKKKAYCCFESKLTRILQEQGRPQINKPWAKPKDETCQGFTIDEFSRLDLSKMDFTEIYSEFLEAAKLPDEAQMATDIQAKIRAYYQQNGAN